MVIYPGLIASDFLITQEDEEKHAFQIWLWDSHKTMKQWAKLYADEIDENAQAFFSDVLAETHNPCQFIGHLHFVKDDWNSDTVAHELMHGFFRYIKVCFIDFTRALFLEWRDEKEQLCYEYGYWMEWTYNWLFDHNPQEQWKVTNKNKVL